MLKQLGSLFEKRPVRAEPKPEIDEKEPIKLGVWPPKRRSRSFSKQFYATGMLQPPPIPESLRRVSH